MVVNIDRIRKEYTNGTTIKRATREWASTLRTATVHPMKCDIENGGDDKRAYLIVPSAMLTEAKEALAHYKHSLRNPTYHSGRIVQHENTETNSQRPTEIYVPTAAVLRNLKAIQQLQSTPYDIWRAAPESIRAATLTPTPAQTGTHPTHPTRTPNGQQPFSMCVYSLVSSSS